jgi:hypothetical protein
LMHYQSPSEALEFAYRFTRNVTLKQDYKQSISIVVYSDTSRSVHEAA